MSLDKTGEEGPLLNYCTNQARKNAPADMHSLSFIPVTVAGMSRDVANCQKFHHSAETLLGIRITVRKV